MNRIPALSLHRPWSALIAEGHKDIENRAWRTSYRGPLLIHSAKPWDVDALTTAGQIAELNRFSWHQADDPTGIVGVVEVDDVCSASFKNPLHRCNCGPWAAVGQHHWRLGNAYPFDEPITCPGRQQLWTPPDDVWPAVERALTERRRAEAGAA